MVVVVVEYKNFDVDHQRREYLAASCQTDGKSQVEQFDSHGFCS